MGLKSYLSGLFKGFYSLLVGLRVTNSYFFHPSRIVTQQVPREQEDS